MRRSGLSQSILDGFQMGRMLRQDEFTEEENQRKRAEWARQDAGLQAAKETYGQVGQTSYEPAAVAQGLRLSPEQQAAMSRDIADFGPEGGRSFVSGASYDPTKVADVSGLGRSYTSEQAGKDYATRLYGLNPDKAIEFDSKQAGLRHVNNAESRAEVLHPVQVASAKLTLSNAEHARDRALLDEGLEDTLRAIATNAPPTEVEAVFNKSGKVRVDPGTLSYVPVTDRKGNVVDYKVTGKSGGNDFSYNASQLEQHLLSAKDRVTARENQRWHDMQANFYRNLYGSSGAGGAGGLKSEKEVSVPIFDAATGEYVTEKLSRQIGKDGSVTFKNSKGEVVDTDNYGVRGTKTPFTSDMLGAHETLAAARKSGNIENVKAATAELQALKEKNSAYLLQQDVTRFNKLDAEEQFGEVLSQVSSGVPLADIEKAGFKLKPEVKQALRKTANARNLRGNSPPVPVLPGRMFDPNTQYSSILGGPLR